MPKRITVVQRKLGREGRREGGDKPLYGQADQHGRIIEIDPRQDAFSMLDTLVHESIHISRVDFTEKQVMKLSVDISRVLWREGYRKTILK